MERQRTPGLLTLQLQHHSGLSSHKAITALDSKETLIRAVPAIRGITPAYSDDQENTMMSDLGTPISSGRTAEIYHWDPEHVLKLFYGWVALESIENEARIAGTIYESGLPVPEEGEMVQVGNRTGLIYQRVYGDSMYKAAQGRPWNIFRYLRRSAELHAEIHSHSISAGLPAQRQILERHIRQSEWDFLFSCAHRHWRRWIPCQTVTSCATVTSGEVTS